MQKASGLVVGMTTVLGPPLGGFLMWLVMPSLITGLMARVNVLPLFLAFSYLFGLLPALFTSIYLARRMADMSTFQSWKYYGLALLTTLPWSIASPSHDSPGQMSWRIALLIAFFALILWTRALHLRDDNSRDTAFWRTSVAFVWLWFAVKLVASLPFTYSFLRLEDILCSPVRTMLGGAFAAIACVTYLDYVYRKSIPFHTLHYYSIAVLAVIVPIALSGLTHIHSLIIFPTLIGAILPPVILHLFLRKKASYLFNESAAA